MKKNYFFDEMMDAMKYAMEDMMDEGIEVNETGDEEDFGEGVVKTYDAITEEELEMYERRRRHFAPENVTDEEIACHPGRKYETA